MPSAPYLLPPGELGTEPPPPSLGELGGEQGRPATPCLGDVGPPSFGEEGGELGKLSQPRVA